MPEIFDEIYESIRPYAGDFNKVDSQWTRVVGNPQDPTWKSFLKTHRDTARAADRDWLYIGNFVYQNLKTGKFTSLSPGEDGTQSKMRNALNDEFFVTATQQAQMDKEQAQRVYGEGMSKVTAGAPMMGSPMAMLASNVVGYAKEAWDTMTPSSLPEQDAARAFSNEAALQDTTDALNQRLGSFNLPLKDMTPEEVEVEAKKTPGIYALGGGKFINTAGDGPERFTKPVDEMRQINGAILHNDEIPWYMTPLGPLYAIGKSMFGDNQIPVGTMFPSVDAMGKIQNRSQMRMGNAVHTVLTKSNPRNETPELYIESENKALALAKATDNPAEKEMYEGLASEFRNKARVAQTVLKLANGADALWKMPVSNALLKTAAFVEMGLFDIAGYGVLSLAGGLAGDEGLTEEQRYERAHKYSFEGDWGDRYMASMASIYRNTLDNFGSDKPYEFAGADPLIRLAVEDATYAVAPISRSEMHNSWKGMAAQTAVELFTFGAMMGASKLLEPVTKVAGTVGRYGVERAKWTLTGRSIADFEAAPTRAGLQNLVYATGGKQNTIQALENPIFQRAFFGKKLTATEQSVMIGNLNDLISINPQAEVEHIVKASLNSKSTNEAIMTDAIDFLNAFGREQSMSTGALRLGKVKQAGDAFPSPEQFKKEFPMPAAFEGIPEAEELLKKVSGSVDQKLDLTGLTTTQKAWAYTLKGANDSMEWLKKSLDTVVVRGPESPMTWAAGPERLRQTAIWERSKAVSAYSTEADRMVKKITAIEGINNNDVTTNMMIRTAVEKASGIADDYEARIMDMIYKATNYQKRYGGALKKSYYRVVLENSDPEIIKALQPLEAVIKDVPEAELIPTIMMHMNAELRPWRNRDELAMYAEQLLQPDGLAKFAWSPEHPMYNYFKAIQGVRQMVSLAELTRNSRGLKGLSRIAGLVEDYDEMVGTITEDIFKQNFNSAFDHVDNMFKSLRELPEIGDAIGKKGSVKNMADGVQASIYQSRDVMSDFIDGESIGWWLDHSNAILKHPNVQKAWAERSQIRDFWKVSDDMYNEALDMFEMVGEKTVRPKLGYYHHMGPDDAEHTVSRALKMEYAGWFDTGIDKYMKARRGKVLEKDFTEQAGRYYYNPITNPIDVATRARRYAAQGRIHETMRSYDGYLHWKDYALAVAEPHIAHSVGMWPDRLTRPEVLKNLPEDIRKIANRYSQGQYVSGKDVKKLFAQWEVMEGKEFLGDNINHFRDIVHGHLDESHQWARVSKTSFRSSVLPSMEMAKDARRQYMNFVNLEDAANGGIIDSLMKEPNVLLKSDHDTYISGVRAMVDDYFGQAYQVPPEMIDSRTIGQFLFDTDPNEGMAIVRHLEELISTGKSTERINNFINNNLKEFNADDFEFMIDLATARVMKGAEEATKNEVAMWAANGAGAWRNGSVEHYFMPKMAVDLAKRMDTGTNLYGLQRGINRMSKAWKNLIFFMRFSFRTTNSMSDFLYAFSQSPGLAFDHSALGVEGLSSMERAAGAVPLLPAMTNIGEGIAEQFGLKGVSKASETMYELQKSLLASDQMYNRFAKEMLDSGYSVQQLRDSATSSRQWFKESAIGAGGSEVVSETFQIGPTFGKPIAKGVTKFQGAFSSFEEAPKAAQLHRQMVKIQDAVSRALTGHGITTEQALRASEEMYVRTWQKKLKEIITDPITQGLNYRGEERYLRFQPFTKQLNDLGSVSGKSAEFVKVGMRKEGLEIPSMVDEIVKTSSSAVEEGSRGIKSAIKRKGEIAGLGELYELRANGRKVGTISDMGDYKTITMAKDVAPEGWEGIFVRGKKGFVHINDTPTEGMLAQRFVLSPDLQLTGGGSFNKMPILDGVASMSAQTNINYSGLSTFERHWFSQGWIPFYTFHSQFMRSSLTGIVGRPHRALATYGALAATGEAMSAFNDNVFGDGKGRARWEKAMANDKNRWARGMKYYMYMGKTADNMDKVLAFEMPHKTFLSNMEAVGSVFDFTNPEGIGEVIGQYFNHPLATAATNLAFPTLPEAEKSRRQGARDFAKTYGLPKPQFSGYGDRNVNSFMIGLRESYVGRIDRMMRNYDIIYQNLEKQSPHLDIADKALAAATIMANIMSYQYAINPATGKFTRTLGTAGNKTLLGDSKYYKTHQRSYAPKMWQDVWENLPLFGEFEVK